MKKKTPLQKVNTKVNASKLNNDVIQYVFRGFNKNDKDDVGFLSLKQYNVKHELSKCYYIVEDIDDASRFPSKNIKNIEGFGTPQQWLKFFEDEPELHQWKFHLLKVAK